MQQILSWRFGAKAVMAFVDEFGLIKTAETLEPLGFLEYNFARKPTLSKSLAHIILRALSSCPNEL